MATQLATGATFTWESGFLASVESFDMDEMTREMVDVSHMGTTTWRDYLAGNLWDPGGAQVELQHDGTAAPPMGAFSSLSVQLADGTGFSVSAAMQGYKITGTLEGKVMAAARLKFSGAITFATTPT